MARDYGQPRQAPHFNPDLRWSSGKNARTRHSKRVRVWQKTGGYCFHCGCELDFCGFDAFQMDHFIPKSKGGSNAIENLNPSCPPCNSSRKDNQAWTGPVKKPSRRDLSYFLAELEQELSGG